METIRIINFIITVIFALCYTYQFVYVPVSLLMQRRDRKNMNAPDNSSVKHIKHYAVLISARNEEHVIGQLIDSINKREYILSLLGQLEIDVFSFVKNNRCPKYNIFYLLGQKLLIIHSISFCIRHISHSHRSRMTRSSCVLRQG